MRLPDPRKSCVSVVVGGHRPGSLVDMAKYRVHVFSSMSHMVASKKGLSLRCVHRMCSHTLADCHDESLKKATESHSRHM